MVRALKLLFYILFSRIMVAELGRLPIMITEREGHGDCRVRVRGSLMAAGHVLSSWGC